MAKRCELTGVGVQTGNNVSHSQRKTKRRFLPNLRNISLRSQALDKDISLRISAATLRSVDHNGGLDNFLLTASSNKLAELGQKLRRKIQKALAAANDNGAAKPKANKKEAAKKSPARKSVAKKEPAKKAAPKKTATKKAAPKKKDESK